MVRLQRTRAGTQAHLADPSHPRRSRCMTLIKPVLFCCMVAVALGQDQQSQPKADVVFLHGNIYTGIAVTASFHEIKRADAMAIRGDRIQAVGKEEEILKLKGPQSEVV